MLKNYFKIAWRSIVRHKTYAFINVLGLALGICTCIVIFLIAHFEFSTDRFHPDKGRIYRLVETVVTPDGHVDQIASAPMDIAPLVREKFSGIETIASYYLYNARIAIPGNGDVRLRYDNLIEGSHRPTTILAEPEYFDIFKYDWLAGSAVSALTAPNTVVLTASKAAKYFGKVAPAEVLGREMVFNDSVTVRVTGVVKDWKDNTEMPFGEFISFRTAKRPALWAKLSDRNMEALSPFNSRAFVKLPVGVSPDRLVADLKDYSKLIKERPGVQYQLGLQPLVGMHFNMDVYDGFRKAHLPTLYMLMAVAVFILLLAAINFINLSTAMSLKRAKEIGVRKVMGSSRRSIAFQFLSETFLLIVGALLIALLAVKPMLAAFRSFIPDGVDDHIFSFGNVGFVLFLVILTTLLAGAYPAKVLSAYLPVLSLKGGMQKGEGKWYLRKGLIVFQFSVALVFIISTIIISRQINYMRTKDLGFNADAVVSLNAEPRDGSPDPKQVAERIARLPGVRKIALQSFNPLSDFKAGFDLQYKGKTIQSLPVALQIADTNFISLYGIHLLAGRNLIPALSRDSIMEFVINETLSKSLGFQLPQEAVGKYLYMGDRPYPIVGVVADFHENSYRDPIRPLAIFDLPQAEHGFAVKLASDGKSVGVVKNTLVQMERIWKEVYPDAPFDYAFLDESIAALYKKEEKTATLMNVAPGITIFISCMGLLGLSMFTASQRTKEMGIRKVLGATVMDITSLLTRDFMVLICLSLVIASPVAWYATHRWLEDFLYRESVGIWIFLLAGLLALALGLLTVGFQAVKAARANPVDSLRAE